MNIWDNFNFYKSGEEERAKKELYYLLRKKILIDKRKIISYPAERYNIITPFNLNSKQKKV